MRSRERLLDSFSIISARLAGCSESDSAQTQSGTDTQTEVEMLYPPLRGVINPYSDVVTVSSGEWSDVNDDYETAAIHIENDTDSGQVVAVAATFYDADIQQVGTESRESVIQPDAGTALSVKYPDDLPTENPSFSITVESVEEYSG